MTLNRFVQVCLLALACSSCAGLRSSPGVYEIVREPLKAGPRRIHLIYARPLRPTHPDYLVVFATGDGGWRSVSSDVFEHLAAEGYQVAGIDSSRALRPVLRAGERMSTTQATARVMAALADAKGDLGLPESTPVIVVGFSRGATLVAFAALHPELRQAIGGAIALGLTREVDYLRTPRPERVPEIQVDSRGRVQIYPALKLLGSTPLAVIQSTHDPYVPAAESRELLGPDTPTLRLYEVDARNHRFGGARDRMIADVDDALRWILASRGK
jgi:alpha-beta hydrolase superfamily lysophospholipase